MVGLGFSSEREVKKKLSLVVQNFLSNFQNPVWWYVSVFGTRVFLCIWYLGRHVFHHLFKYGLVLLLVCICVFGTWESVFGFWEGVLGI